MNTDAKMINTMNPENSNECKDGLPAEKSMNKIYHIHGRKTKNHMITWIDGEKASDNVQHPFMTKTFSKIEINITFSTCN